MTPRQRNVFWTVVAVYAAVCVPIGWHRGGDLVQELGLTEHWLRGMPLYIANPAMGVYWPPFTIAALSPYALLGRVAIRLAQAAWTVTSAVLLAWAMAACAARWGWRAVLLATLAVAKPLQANFERLNLGAVLLALIVAAAIDLEDGRDRRAAIWIGLASALKMFPALLIPYLALRRRWSAAGLAAALAVGCTVLPMLRYGPAGALSTVHDWLALSRASPEAQGFRAQMLGGMVVGVGGSLAAAVAVDVALTALVLAALTRRAPDAPSEVGLVTQLAVLLSPIGWFHYEILALPAWVGALAHPGPPWSRWWWPILLLAGVFLSGVLSFDHIYPEALLVVKRFNYVWGALLLMLALSLRRFAAAPPPRAGAT